MTDARLAEGLTVILRGLATPHVAPPRGWRAPEWRLVREIALFVLLPERDRLAADLHARAPVAHTRRR